MTISEHATYKGILISEMCRTQLELIIIEQYKELRELHEELRLLKKDKK